MSLRVPESLSMNLAQSATREALKEFFKMLKTLFQELGIADQPERIGNRDKSGFMFVMRSGKNCSFHWQKIIFTSKHLEKTTTTVPINGDSIPPMVIFKDTADAASKVTASKDSYITKERIDEPCETLEENCNMRHQSNEDE
ncbi:hypothetical protein HHI36_021648 [Cryptolaemus montrouzieri]|uniref:Uncharacterized protein n=1 Tax=Cryptolaemus montrouzieri TaxID=559131 RepID=A0ABD2MXT1_9CUCU